MGGVIDLLADRLVEACIATREPRTDTAPPAEPPEIQLTLPVTADAILAFARRYDQDERGGVGRGLIDEELAERLAAWLNARALPPRLSVDDAAQPSSGSAGRSIPIDVVASEISDLMHGLIPDRSDIAAIEAEVGVASGDWGTVRPADLIRAAWRRCVELRAR